MYQEPSRPEILSKAIEKLYSVFSRYSTWNKNPIELEDHKAQTLLSKKMADLTAKDLNEFVFSVLLTWGDENDFRHFLPRILELCTESSSAESGRMDCPELVFSRLRYASWRTWQEDEQEAIEQFLAVWYDSTLAQFPCRTEFHSVITSSASLFDNVVPYLMRWSETYSPAAFRHFIESRWYIANPSSFISRDQAEAMKEWHVSARTLDWLLNGYLQYSDEPWADELAAEIDVVELSSAYRRAKKGLPN